MKIFYTPEMVADAGSFSKSPLKPKVFTSAAVALFGDKVSVVKPEPVTIEDLCLAHKADYVKGVLSRKYANGFGNRSAQVAASLPWTSGSMYSASLQALQDGIACSPTSGFHHAGFEDGGGFCTFNGLMVAAIKLYLEKRVLTTILDFDQHYGDGTVDIWKKRKMEKVIFPYSTGGDPKAYEGGWAKYRDEFLIPKLLPFTIRRSGLVMYQAGADCHVDDPLGGWLTTAEMKERDEIILGTLLEAGVPVVWNLAGGYSPDFESVIDLHLTTLGVSLQSIAQPSTV